MSYFEAGSIDFIITSPTVFFQLLGLQTGSVSLYRYCGPLGSIREFDIGLFFGNNQESGPANSSGSMKKAGENE